MRWARRLVLGGAVVLTTAGACQQSADGPLPPPDEIGADELPAGATRGGLTAVYSELIREEPPDGTQCHRLYRLAPDGTAEAAEHCSTDSPGAVAADAATWERDAEVGDYVYADGRLWIRLVSWDVITEDYDVVSMTATYCDTQLRYERERTGGGVTEAVADLVVGSPPPDAEPCN